MTTFDFKALLDVDPVRAVEILAPDLTALAKENPDLLQEVEDFFEDMFKQIEQARKEQFPDE